MLARCSPVLPLSHALWRSLIYNFTIRRTRFYTAMSLPSKLGFWKPQECSIALRCCLSRWSAPSNLQHIIAEGGLVARGPGTDLEKEYSQHRHAHKRALESPLQRGALAFFTLERICRNSSPDSEVCGRSWKPEVSFPFCTRWDDRNAILDFSTRWKTTRVSETHASKMKLRLLKGKRKKKEGKKMQRKQEMSLRDGESNCDFGLEFRLFARNGVKFTPGLPRLANW